MSDPDYQEDQFGQVRMVGRISLWFTLVALAGLLAIMVSTWLAFSGLSDSFSLLAMNAENLPWLMLAGGSSLCIATGWVTVRVCLYSSFRLAGPLHRFCCSIEDSILGRADVNNRTRRFDYLRDQSRQLQAAFSAMDAHNRGLAARLQTLLAELESGQASVALVEVSLKQLKSVECRVQVTSRSKSHRHSTEEVG